MIGDWYKFFFTGFVYFDKRGLWETIVATYKSLSLQEWLNWQLTRATSFLGLFRLKTEDMHGMMQQLGMREIPFVSPWTNIIENWRLRESGVPILSVWFFIPALILSYVPLSRGDLRENLSQSRKLLWLGITGLLTTHLLGLAFAATHHYSYLSYLIIIIGCMEIIYFSKWGRILGVLIAMNFFITWFLFPLITGRGLLIVEFDIFFLNLGSLFYQAYSYLINRGIKITR